MGGWRRLRIWLRHAVREQRGNTMVLFSASLTAFVAVAAIAVDVGRMYSYRQELRVIADGAVLAGARALPDTSAAQAAAQAILDKNKVTQMGATSSITVTASTVDVSLNRTVGTIFAQLLGIESTALVASAGARSGPASKVTGIVPIGVPAQTFSYGQRVTIKFSSENNELQSPGNFGALSLSGNGASAYRNDLEHGYGNPVQIGDWLTTKPGNMAGPTEDGIEDRLEEAPDDTWDEYAPQSSRLVFLPIVDFGNVNGRSEVQVVGFGAFFLEDVDDGEITGRYVRAVTEADISAAGTADYGLRSVKLSQ